MKKVEKEFQQISEFIDKSRNAAVGFMNYAASLENLCSRWLGKLCSRKMHNWRLPLNLCILKMHKRLKYTLDRTMSPMMVAEYRRLLIPEEVLKRSLEEYCAFMKKDEMHRS